MPTFTDNHGFGRPVEGGDTDDWGRILNEDLIDELEQDVWVRDLEANRTNYTAYNGSLFISTDTGVVYLGDGATWNELDIDVATHASTHSEGGSDPINVTNLVDSDTKADLTAPGGVLVSSQLPQLSITSVDVVADQAARLALDAEEGDFAIQQDNDTSYILSTNDPTVDGNWIEIDFDAVSAIAGQAIAPASVDATTVTSDLTDTDEVQNQDYNESVNTQTATTGTVTVDLSLANLHQIEADGDITISFSNVTSSPAGNSLTIYLYDDDATGPHTITWPASVVWSNGNAETTIPSGGNIEVSLITADGGTTWRARLSGEEFA